MPKRTVKKKKTATKKAVSKKAVKKAAKKTTRKAVKKAAPKAAKKATKKVAKKTAKKAARRRTGLKGISRIDQDEKHNHGWFVRVTRKGKTYSSFFTDKKHGGKGKALAAAKIGLEVLREKYPPMSRKEFARVQRRKTKSGIVGVTRLTKKVKGKDYDFWQATWSPKTGVIEKKVYSITKYGEKKAKSLAVKARRKGIQDMED
jgi:hypothetical protein